MNNIEIEFKKEFGLNHIPEIEEIELWINFFDNNISAGFSTEISGIKAAKEIFKDYHFNPVWLNESQSDTITALLAQAREKIKTK